MRKTIVVLANSKKPGGRCLAGKELIRKQDSWEVGSWIRPVTSEDSGAIPGSSMAMALGHVPRLLEIVEIPFSRPVPLPGQPENWLLEMPIQLNSWLSRGRFAWSNIGSLLDRPAGLWHEPPNPRRVTPNYVKGMKNPASLFLIKPDRIQNIEVWSESNQFQPVKRRRRATLRFAGVTHVFDIDDMDFENKYCPQFPDVGEPPVNPKLGKPEETLICVSLTPKHTDNNHYKIAAAFFEPPV